MATQQVSQEHSLCSETELTGDAPRAEQAMVLSSQSSSEHQSSLKDTRADDALDQGRPSTEKPLVVSYYHPLNKAEFNHSFTKNYLLDHSMEAMEDSISSIDTTRTSNLRTDGGLMDLSDLAALMMPPSVTRPTPMVRKSQGNMAA